MEHVPTLHQDGRSMHHRTHRLRPIGLITLFLLSVLATSASAIDVVIFKDGFSVQGRRFKEREVVNDRSNSVAVEIPAVRGFDVVETGPKFFIFSNRAKQVGKIIDNIPAEKDLKAYSREVLPKGFTQLPGYGEFQASDYDANWKRTIKVNTGGGNWQLIEQRIRSISPKSIIAPSVTHRWYPQYDPREMDPREIRRLLSTHPELEEQPGKVEPLKRLAMAQFMADIGWLPLARLEIEQAKKDAPGAWTKDETERLDRLTSELSQAECKVNVEALDVALSAGRYGAAGELIEKFDDAKSDALSLKRFTEMKAAFELIQPRYENTRELLQDAIDELTNGKTATAASAASSVLVYPLIQTRPINDAEAAIVLAAREVFHELHPDSADRLESFRLLAQDRIKQRQAGKSGTSSVELLALAVSGWVLGKNGADKNLELALKYWQWREGLLAYQNESTIYSRRTISTRLFGQKAKEPVDPEILAQVISYLPPPSPEDLSQRSGTRIPASEYAVDGIYRRNTGSVAQNGNGVDYLIRLPAEYHHGRPYPVILALTHHTMPAEQMLSLLAAYSDRAGYILVAPIWVNQFDQEYDWSGDQHYVVQGVLRDLLRHFRVDNDRVFLFGFGQGGNFAIDVGASHPDLFAGVVAMGATPRVQNMLMVYWPNFQKLPLYVTIGAMSGGAFENLRRWYEFMMPLGFPAVASVYKGRGTEWFTGELPSLFDWMGRKKRVTGTAALRLNETTRVEEWATMRLQDNRFYWIGTDSIVDRCLLSLKPEGRGILPAKLFADIDKQNGNLIRIRTQGVKNVSIWLDRDMIDWSKPVRVSLNGSAPLGYRAKVLEPDLDLMLEQLYEHGDRSLLFLNKLEFKAIP